MATIPTFEEILYEAQSCFGFPFGRTIEKCEFLTLGAKIKKTDEKIEEILKQVLETLELEEDDSNYFFEASMEFFRFYKEVELNLWTSGAEKKQVIWFTLGYIFIPFLARTAANWNIDGFKEKGMPNQFWYLPKIHTRDGKESLLLPIHQVMEWLEDLLSQPMDQFKEEAFEEQSIEPESVERNLYNWKKDKLPNASTINRYFSDESKFTFKGCYQPNINDSRDNQFEDALVFLRKTKSLDEEGIRDQLLLATKRLDNIFSMKASVEDKELFVEATIDRYAIPKMSTIRKRFLLARASQDAYQKLLGTLCPSISPTETNPRKNKLVQIIFQYQRIFNLTTEAYNQYGPNQDLEDQWFDKQLFDFEKMTTLLSISPSKKSEYTAECLGDYLTNIFKNIDKESNLEDHYPECNDREDIKKKALFHLDRVNELSNNMKKIHSFVNYLYQLKKPSEFLETYHDTEVLLHALGGDFPSEISLLLLKHLEKIVASPQEKLYLIMFKLDMFINKKQNRNISTQKTVYSLLEEAETNKAYDRWEAVFLQYKAKHHLFSNEFGGQNGLAEKYFKEALEACEKNNYGPMRGEIARDAFATQVANRKLNRGHHEKYFRNLLRYMEVEGTDVTLENAEQEMRCYFWEDLYSPYPHIEKLSCKL